MSWLTWLRVKLKGWKTAIAGLSVTVAGFLLALQDALNSSGVDPHVFFPSTMTTYKVGLILAGIGFVFTALRTWTNTQVGSAHFHDGTPAISHPLPTIRKEPVVQSPQITSGMYKLGRKPRSYNPAIPHLSAWIAGKTLAPIPVEVDYTKHMNPNYGMMLNDTLGCCTCAAFYHARQVWTANVPGGSEQTDPDKDILRLYEWAAGFDPKDPSTDQGAVCQNILRYIQNHGAPIGKEMHWDRILGFVEADVRNLDDVKRIIWETGISYIGFEVPQSIMPYNAPPPDIWRVDESNSKILGGHCVVLCGYNNYGAWVISWGKKYFMEWSFFLRFCVEAYGIIAREWFDAQGKTVLGMTADELKQQMSAINALQLAA